MRHRSPKVGERFSKLVALSPANRLGGQWLCRCDCGTTRPVARAFLIRGTQKSCGCLNGFNARRARRLTHGLSEEPEYAVWKGIKERCLNEHHKQFYDYGGRGISICQRWRDSIADFVADMGRRPSMNHQIDRIDPDGNYEPGNCRWLLREAQMQNRRDVPRCTLDGERIGVRKMARFLAMPHSTLEYKLKSARHD